MINHPLTILQRMPAFAKPGLIRRNPPVQVGEGTCQVQRRQPVLIRYQIREVSGSRRTGATLLFLTHPKPLPTNASLKTQPPHFAYSFRSPSTPPASAATHSKTIRPINASQPVTWLAARSTAEFLPAVNAVNHIRASKFYRG